LERLNRLIPVVNVAERLNGWNDWNGWNEPFSMEVRICLMLLVNCWILSPQLLPHSKTGRVEDWRGIS
jgi:hypothetical protein